MGKRSVAALVFICIASAFMLGLAVSRPIHDPDNVITLPPSLATYYPPLSDSPSYYYAMLQVGQTFSGIMVDAMEGDVEYARQSIDSLKTQFAALGRMVPEWKQHFDNARFEVLESALAGGQPHELVKAMDTFAETCNACHHQYMAPVALKFRWTKSPDFPVTDPIINQELTYSAFKQALEGSMTGIGLDLKQGQTDRAKMHLGQFRQRMKALSQACFECHTSDREYYVDESIFKHIDNLETVLSAETIDENKFGVLMTRIGTESCEACHQVHVPGAYVNFLVR